MKRVVLGLAGPINSGKGVASKYLIRKYGFHKIEIGDLVRDAAKKEGLPAERSAWQELQRERIKKYGVEYWIMKACKEIKEKQWEKALIDGIRYPTDVTVPKREFGEDYKVILIDAPFELRCERAIRRARPGDPKTPEEFYEQEQKENQHFDLDETFAKADYKIINDGSIKELHQKIDVIIKKVLSDFSNRATNP